MNQHPLISQALLGSARMSALPGPPVAELESVWPTWDPQQATTCLLDALAITRSLHLAGNKCKTIELAVEPCPDEIKPYISARQEQAGNRLLNGEFPELLGEWFAHIVEQQLIVPPRMLANLLPFGTRNKSYRTALRDICGERGLWLAKRHSAFSWLLEEALPSDEAWDQGQPAERIAWLHHMRRIDPERAMQAVMSQWSGEEPRMRESIIQTIAASPTLADLDFLQNHASQDRRQDIRQAIRSALLQIPESTMFARAIERALSCLTWKNKQWHVEAPTTYQKEWASDDIKEKAPATVGQRAWWLQQIIALVPLHAWTNHLNVSAETLFSGKMDGDWSLTVAQGWMDAARLVPSPDCLAPLILRLVDMSQNTKNNFYPFGFIQESLANIPPTLRGEILEQIADKLQKSHMLDLLERHLTAFPQGKGQNCLAIIREHLYNPKNGNYRNQARALATCFPLENISRELHTIAQQPQLSSFAEEFAATLEFRQTLFSSPTTQSS